MTKNLNKDVENSQYSTYQYRPKILYVPNADLDIESP